ncbi:MAG: tautomerase family protein [Flaviflexus sp.]|uniref:tautomerase family protein n=1 Tax=Flaviflexus sp. TaxID=1969482 RepID=UPI00352FB11F
MPLVRIDVPESTSPINREAISNVVYDALVKVAGAPGNDKFVIISSHDTQSLIMDPTYVFERTEQTLIIQVTLNAGRTIEVKKAFYKAVATGINEATGIPINDIFINLVEVPQENWSFGGNEAQYA